MFSVFSVLQGDPLSQNSHQNTPCLRWFSKIRLGIQESLRVPPTVCSMFFTCVNGATEEIFGVFGKDSSSKAFQAHKVKLSSLLKR